MLSALKCAQAASMLKAACFRLGVTVVEVNPAYTSVIGAVNFAQRFGISIHQGAALAIARRGLGLRDKPARRVGVAPTRNGGHVAFDLPVRSRSKHVWTFWAGTRRQALSGSCRALSVRGEQPRAAFGPKQHGHCAPTDLPRRDSSARVSRTVRLTTLATCHSDEWNSCQFF